MSHKTDTPFHRLSHGLYDHRVALTAAEIPAQVQALDAIQMIILQEFKRIMALDEFWNPHKAQTHPCD